MTVLRWNVFQVDHFEGCTESGTRHLTHKQTSPFLMDLDEHWDLAVKLQRR